MISLLLFGCLLISVECRDRLADRAFFGKDPLLSFVPAYPLENDGRAIYDWEVRTAHFKIVPKTKFHITWNPVKCINEDGNHQVWLSFLKDWLPESDLEAEEIKSNAISFTFKAHSQKPSTNSTRPHFYNVNAYSKGKPTGLDFDWPLNMQNAGFFVETTDEYARLSVYFQGMYNSPAYMKTTDIPENTRYMAVFGSQQYICPVFISAIDDNFPVWLPGVSVTKYAPGRQTPPREDPYLINSTIFSLMICALVLSLGAVGHFHHYYLNTGIKKKEEEEEDSEEVTEKEELETDKEGSSNPLDSDEQTKSLVSARSLTSVIEEWGMDASFPQAPSESPSHNSNVESSNKEKEDERESFTPFDLPADSIDTTKTGTRTSDEHTKVSKSITPEDVPKWV